MKTNEELEEIGNALSKELEWDGVEILRVAAVALADANFHSEAEVIEAMIEAIEASAHTAPSYTLVVDAPLPAEPTPGLSERVTALEQQMAALSTILSLTNVPALGTLPIAP